MTLFDQLMSVAADWLKRRDAKSKLDRLMELVANTHAALNGNESPYLTLAMERLEKAEAARSKAIGYFELDDVDDCEKRCERGLMHLMIASLHLSADASHRLEIIFDEDSADFVVEKLAGSIAKFKLAVEYSNCAVSDHVKERFWEVARNFDDALDLLKKGDDDEAKRMAEGNLLRLHHLAKILEHENSHGVIELDPVAKDSPREMHLIKDLTEHISQAQCLLSVSQTRGYTRVERYLAAAVDNLEKALEAYCEGDDATVKRMVTAGSMESRMAAQLCKTGPTTEMAFDPRAAATTDEVPTESAEFCRRLVSMSRLIRDNSPEPERLLNRLDAVDFYYRKCMNALIEGDFKEAKRSARSAHLDLDFSRQLFAHGDAVYSDL